MQNFLKDCFRIYILLIFHWNFETFREGANLSFSPAICFVWGEEQSDTIMFLLWSWNWPVATMSLWLRYQYCPWRIHIATWGFLALSNSLDFYFLSTGPICHYYQIKLPSFIVWRPFNSSITLKSYKIIGKGTIELGWNQIYYFLCQGYYISRKESN